MTFTAEQSQRFTRECAKVVQDLQSLMLEGLTQSQAITNEAVRRHLLHGAGRRICVMKRSMERIFELFPPSEERPLQRDVLTDVQINLHAFVINLSGVFDNWAWAFILRHDLLPKVGSQTNVGVFKKQTQQLLPGSLQEYLASQDIANWHQDYAKGYRDALAHRIPLYIPPASWTEEDKIRYEQLEAEKIACIRAHEWERLDEVWNEQEGVGKSCLFFLHDVSAESNARPVYLHPQVLCDAMTVVHFGNKFYETWHEHA